MNKLVVVALICLNVGLLFVLVFGQGTPTANAQASYYNETNYIMVTGRIETGYEVLYIIDMATQRLGAWKFSLGDRRMMPMPSRPLSTDFRGR